MHCEYYFLVQNIIACALFIVDAYVAFATMPSVISKKKRDPNANRTWIMASINVRLFPLYLLLCKI